MGAFLNRFRIHISTILGCLSCSAGLAMGSFVPSMSTLYIAFSLPYAVGASLIYISSPITATYYFNKRKSIAVGIVTAGQGLGTMILGPALQALGGVLDWRNTFRVFSGLQALASLAGCLLGVYQEFSIADEQNESLSKKFRLNLSLLKNPSVLILITTAGAYGFSRRVSYVHLVRIVMILYR